MDDPYYPSSEVKHLGDADTRPCQSRVEQKAAGTWRKIVEYDQRSSIPVFEKDEATPRGERVEQLPATYRRRVRLGIDSV